MAIATYSSALNDRALCTSIALTRYDEVTCRPFHRSRGRAGQARRDGGTSVSARALLRYVVRVQDAAFGGDSEDISFLLRPCLFSTCIPTPAMVLVQLLYLSARISSAGRGLPVESGLSGVAALQKLLEERDHPVGGGAGDSLVQERLSNTSR